MIYFLEDDTSIREFVIYTLNSQGLEAQGFERPSAFWAALEQRLPSLVLLDIMLPEEDGLSVLKRLRSASSTRRIPIIMLTAKSTEFDKVVGLDSGADDYIPKPFGMMELLARIKALLRRTEDAPAELEYMLGGLYVCPAKHIVRVDGQPVTLTLKEFELLCMLLENSGIVLTRAQLLDRIWGYAFDGESRTVDVHVRTLRQKLGPCGSLIQTVRGIGYKIGEREARPQGRAAQLSPLQRRCCSPASSSSSACSMNTWGNRSRRSCRWKRFILRRGLPKAEKAISRV